MANGKIGHFKFVNVEEIKCNEKRKTYKLNPLVPPTIEKETESQPNYNSSHDGKESSVCNTLLSRLNESNGTLNLTDVMQVIGLNDPKYLNRLSINGFNDLKSFAQIGNKDILNEIGISDSSAQHVLLNAAQIIQDYISKPNKTSIKSQTSSQKYFWPKRRHEMVTHSAPTTPAIEFSTDFSELISKLESVSTTSLDNYDEIEHLASITANLRPTNSQSSVQQIFDSNQKSRKENSCDNNDQIIYENNDQIIVLTHEQNSNTLGKQKISLKTCLLHLFVSFSNY